MISVVDLVIYSVASAMLMLLLMALGIAIALPAISRWSKRVYIALFSMLAVCVVLCFLETLVYLNPDYVMEEMIISSLETLFLSVLVPVPTLLLIHYCGENIRESHLFRAVLTLWLIFFILLGIQQFTNWFYFVTPENEFVRTPFFPLMVAPLVIAMIHNIVGLFRRRKKLSTVNALFCCFSDLFASFFSFNHFPRVL